MTAFHSKFCHQKKLLQLGGKSYSQTKVLKSNVLCKIRIKIFYYLKSFMCLSLIFFFLVKNLHIIMARKLSLEQFNISKELGFVLHEPLVCIS